MAHIIQKIKCCLPPPPLLCVQDMSRAEMGEAVQCERELACYLQDCEELIGHLSQELKVLREDKYYQVDQLAFR